PLRSWPSAAGGNHVRRVGRPRRWHLFPRHESLTQRESYPPCSAHRLPVRKRRPIWLPRFSGAVRHFVGAPQHKSERRQLQAKEKDQFPVENTFSRGSFPSSGRTRLRSRFVAPALFGRDQGFASQCHEIPTHLRFASPWY